MQKVAFMNQFMARWRPFDVVTLVVIIISAILIMMGHNGLILAVFIGASGTYLGYDIGTRRRNPPNSGE